jgi:hypothetical protein
MRFKFLGLVGGVCVVWLALPVWAHHSHQNYAISDFKLLEGTVTEIHYLNPHSWVYIEVKDEKGGTPTLWALEATGPTGLLRTGITREDVRVGDTVKVRCHALRDGGPGCLLGFLTPTHGDMARGNGIEKEWD